MRGNAVEIRDRRESRAERRDERTTGEEGGRRKSNQASGLRPSISSPDECERGLAHTANKCRYGAPGTGTERVARMEGGSRGRDGKLTRAPPICDIWSILFSLAMRSALQRIQTYRRWSEFGASTVRASDREKEEEIVKFLSRRPTGGNAIRPEQPHTYNMRMGGRSNEGGANSRCAMSAMCNSFGRP